LAERDQAAAGTYVDWREKLGDAWSRVFVST
jgi:hypothetical protein